MINSFFVTSQSATFAEHTGLMLPYVFLKLFISPPFIHQTPILQRKASSLRWKFQIIWTIFTVSHCQSTAFHPHSLSFAVYITFCSRTMACYEVSFILLGGRWLDFTQAGYLTPAPVKILQVTAGLFPQIFNQLFNKVEIIIDSSVPFSPQMSGLSDNTDVYLAALQHLCSLPSTVSKAPKWKSVR